MTASMRSSTRSATSAAERGDDRLDALVANVPGVVYRCAMDDDWTMHFVSEQMLALTGYPAEDFVANRRRSFDSVIHPDDRPEVRRIVDEATQAGRPFVLTYRIVRADGRVRWVTERGREVAHGGALWLDGVILDVSGQHEAEEALRRSLAEQAMMEERGRIARDLHDSVSQALFSMSLHARAAQLAAQRTGLEEGALRASLDELAIPANGALAEMRALIFELRPGALQEEGLLAAVRKHAAAVASREQVSVTVDGPEHLDLPADVEEALYRITQEALHNATKHARPGAVSVAVRAVAGVLHLEVVDDGVGFAPDGDHPGHYGLSTMRERAEAIGATLTISSARGDGTAVRLSLPPPVAARP
jgi:PAS domain S-box-containing protein